MSLVLEIEFLAGVCRAAHSPANDRPDWPPQPDRVFSALVSAWAARGEGSGERAALEWLEAQHAPAIHAGGYTARTAPVVFVPPNDHRASKAAENYLKVMPQARPAAAAPLPGSPPRRSSFGDGVGGRPGTERAGGAGGARARCRATSAIRRAWCGAGSCRAARRSRSTPARPRNAKSTPAACRS